MSAQPTLALGALRPVDRPSLFYCVGRGAIVDQFRDLAELARKLVTLAEADGAKGLRVAAAPAPSACSDFAPFLAWSVYALEDGGGERWLGHAAIQDTPRERLVEAVRTARVGSARPEGRASAGRQRA